jgi:hypothetical protein
MRTGNCELRKPHAAALSTANQSADRRLMENLFDGLNALHSEHHRLRLGL